MLTDEYCTWTEMVNKCSKVQKTTNNTKHQSDRNKHNLQIYCSHLQQRKTTAWNTFNGMKLESFLNNTRWEIESENKRCEHQKQKLETTK